MIQQKLSKSFGVTFTAANSGVNALLQAADFTYLGAFQIPLNGSNPVTGTNFGYANNDIAYDPSDGNLFIICLNNGLSNGGIPGIAKISIPTLVAGPNNLNQSILVAPCNTKVFKNPSDTIGSIHVHDSRIVWTSYISYDASTQMTASHGVAPLKLGTGSGLYALSSVYPGKVAGPMCDIPSDYQTKFGGYPCLTGRGGGNIITNSNDGPAAVAFNPALLGPTAISCKPFLLYNPGQLEPNSGNSGAGPNLLWTWSNFLRGMFFYSFNGRKCLGFVCNRGKGIFWYGEPTDNGSCSQGDPGPSCFAGTVQDNYIAGKGVHAPPYHVSLYLYDPDVVAAATNIGSVKPYLIMDLPHPFDPNLQVAGATYNSTTRRLYVSLQRVPSAAYEPQPGIVVYKLP